VNRNLGIDLGSRNVKIVLLEEGIIKDKKIFDTANFYRDYCKNENGFCIDLEKLNYSDLDNITTTGYGRNNLNFNNVKIIQELKAHTLGAVFQSGLNDFLLLDIGGQDSKAIQVKNAKMVDIALNDKCAASCGRYLENMANVISVSLDEISKYYENPVKLNSTCAVFSESELIGYISEGVNTKHLIAGVNYSLFNRIKQLVQRFESKNLILSGGVALNKAIFNLFKENTEFENIFILKEPQYNGAIGCCVYGK
jgi:predicted CoA-substrate-specific enzyme activase